MTKEEFLKSIPTRELVSRFKKRFNRWAEETDPIGFSRLVEGGQSFGFDYTVAEVKAELALRPHVPNKRESRGLRLKKIRTGK